MKPIIFLFLIIVPALSNNYIAAETDVSRHSVGVSISNGSAKYKSSSADGDGVAHLYSFYNYRLTPQLSVELGFSGGTELDDWSCNRDTNNEWVCRSDNQPIFNLQADKLNYHNSVFAAKAQLPLSKSNSIYGKIGGHYFDYEFKRNSTKLDNDSGFGFIAEAGWQYQFQSGFRIHAAYQYMDMKDLDVSSFSTGLSYAF